MKLSGTLIKFKAVNFGKNSKVIYNHQVFDVMSYDKRSQMVEIYHEKLGGINISKEELRQLYIREDVTNDIFYVDFKEYDNVLGL